MGKASLRLVGTYSAWSPDVREATYTRNGASDVQMLVRVDGPIVTDASMAQARNDVKLLTRLKHDHVLRMDFVSAVAGRIGSVYEHSGGASLSLLIAAEAAAGRPLPLRVCVEIAGAVALALDEATRVTAPPARVDHPGPEPRDVLIERTGRPRLAGFIVITGDLARRRGFSPPEDRSQQGSPAAMTWMATQFLTELIRGAGREGEVTAALAGAMRAGFSPDPAGRPLPGAYGRLLREVAGDLPGPGLRGWAEVPVRDLLVSARSAEARQAQAAVGPTTRVAPTPAPSRVSTPPATRPLGPSPTIIPDFETEEPGRASLSAATIIPEFDPEFETEEPAIDRPAAESRANALPISVGPSVPPPLAAPRLQQPAATRPVPALPVLPPAPTALTVIEEEARPAPRAGPSMSSLSSAQGPTQGPSFGAPAPAGPTFGGAPGPGPRRIEPMRAEPGGRVDMRIGGAGPDAGDPDDEPVEPAPTRTGLYIGLATVGALSILGLLAAAAAVYYYAPGATPADAPPPDVKADVAPATNDAADALTEPVLPTEPASAPPAASPPAATPSAAAPPAAAPPAAAPAPAAPAASPRAKPPAPAAAPAVDEEPSRIAASESSARVGASSTPATQPTSEPATPAAPDEPGPFDISFRPAEGDITSLEVRCGGQSGSGMIVELNGVPKATSCKITGIGGAAPLQTLVTINAARSYTCFTNGSRACR